MASFLLQGHHLLGQAPLLAPVLEAAQSPQRGHVLDVLDPSPYYVGAVPHRCDVCSQSVCALGCSLCLLSCYVVAVPYTLNISLHMSRMLPRSCVPSACSISRQCRCLDTSRVVDQPLLSAMPNRWHYHLLVPGPAPAVTKPHLQARNSPVLCRPDEDHIRQPSGAAMGQRMEAAQRVPPVELASLASLSQPAEPAVAAPAVLGLHSGRHRQQPGMLAERHGRQEAQKCRPDGLESATQGWDSQEPGQQQGEQERECELGTGREGQAQQQTESDTPGQGTGREHQAQQRRGEPDDHTHVTANRRGRRHARRLQLMLDAAAAMQPAVDPDARPDVSGCQHWVSVQALQLLEIPGLQQPLGNSRGGKSAVERLIQPPSLLSAFSGGLSLIDYCLCLPCP